MAANQPTAADSRTALDSRDNDARTPPEGQATATDRELREKMPESLTAPTRSFAAHGRTFACPSCGAPTSGTCGECGHTHPQLREDPGGR